MSNPYDPSYQPFSGNGNDMGAQYPGGQHAASPYGAQPAQQMPPGAGVYGQTQPGYAPGAAQGYYDPRVPYPQGGFQATPYGAQPQKSGPNVGVIIGIVASVLIIVLVVIIGLAAMRNKSEPSDTSSARPGSSSSQDSSGPSATPSAPASGPSKTPKSTPSSSANAPKPIPSASKGASSGVSAAEEEAVFAECKNATVSQVIKGKFEDWTIESAGKTDDGKPAFLMTGSFTGTLVTGRSGTFTFRCDAIYHPSEQAYEAWMVLSSQ